MKTQEKIKQLTILLLLIFILIGCKNIEKDWEKANSINTIEGYNGFLKNHSDSVYTKLARNAIDSLQWMDMPTKLTTRCRSILTTSCRYCLTTPLLLS